MFQCVNTYTVYTVKEKEFKLDNARLGHITHPFSYHINTQDIYEWQK